eukprot:TRINITY_DN25207_c0_g1_i1.p1 TRINITY_DN25207_c0_g1~~TRINITY_DN25207_c0_g1_i1.p1  ORF type:complete len:305 (-),score=94.00 TRINITY_DN25207_c0_g1_i1:122-997(-)
MAFNSSSKAGNVIILEGNISAGKTTLCKSLAEQCNLSMYLEPTITNPYLEKYYAEPKVYALKMQLWLLRQRFRTYVSAVRHAAETGQSVILDRSVYSDIVFAEKNFADENFTADGYQYYLDLRRQMLENLPIPHMTIYLDTKAETCYERIRSRNRECESGIPLDYLEGLDQCYKNFVELMDKTPSKVVVCDWDNFGAPSDIAAHINAVKTDSVGSWFKDVNGLRSFLYSEARVRSAMVNQTGEFSDDGVSDDDGVDIMEYDIGVENVAEMNRVSQASSKTVEMPQVISMSS